MVRVLGEGLPATVRSATTVPVGARNAQCGGIVDCAVTDRAARSSLPDQQSAERRIEAQRSSAALRPADRGAANGRTSGDQGLHHVRYGHPALTLSQRSREKDHVAGGAERRVVLLHNFDHSSFALSHGRRECTLRR